MLAQDVTISREDAEDLQTNFAAGGCPCSPPKIGPNLACKRERATCRTDFRAAVPLHP
jgi:hypothetical protein